jgi:ribose transport system ATP-binding protein
MAPSTFVAIGEISKTFGSTKALDRVDFEVLPGEIHGLIGQNGSGKSTLIKILSGVHAADPGGTIVVGGQPLSSPPRPAELRRLGVGFVHQDLGLAGDQTVTENVRLGQYRVSRILRRINWRAEAAATRATLDQLHATFAPNRLVNTLLPGERAVVAIGRALQSVNPGGGCVVFDESTQSLPREVLPDFYRTVRMLAQSGISVVIVSHRLDEIKALTDRITVLRDGRVVAGGLNTADLTENEIAQVVLGREIELIHLREEISADGAPQERPVRLRLGSLRTGKLEGFDLEVRAGEVVGITGATNAGHEDIPYALGGLLPEAAGEISIDDRRIALPVGGPREMIRAGVALVPEQRLSEGLAASLSAQENLTLPRVGDRGRFLLLSGWQASEFAAAADRLGIVPRKPHLPIASFSGGNQQKTMLAKWLLNRPGVLVVHEPTQGVDVGARIDILRALREVATGGACVVVCSIEPQDLAFACDRIIVVRNGELACELPAGATAHDITSAIYE